ncbi:hypothetical protein LCGC14_2682110 [marine sediment metagenome]|uniref:Uncharacterized protein n=1 Tax=marine sediment metagenome TaxID=412755 RepID=A0A0F9BVU7_9ZZZZ
MIKAISAAGTKNYYFGTASNKNPHTNPLIEETPDDLKEKVESGYALKTSELGPE